MKSKYFLFFSLIFLILFSSCSNIISEKTSSISFSLGEEVARVINETVPSDNNESLVITCDFNGIPVQTTSIKVKQDQLKDAKISVENIPFEQTFTILLNVLYNNHVVYTGESNPIKLTEKDNFKDVKISINERKSSINYEYGPDFIVPPTVNLVTEYYINKDEVLPTLEKTGYVFDGWFIDKECSKESKIDVLGPSNFLGDVTLYAKWTPACSIIINANDATLTTSTITGKLKKENKDIASFEFPNETDNKLTIEKLEPGNYSIELTGTNTKENYYCDSFTLVNEKDKEVKVNATPNNYYFVKHGAPTGGNGTQAKPYNDFPTVKTGEGALTFDQDHEMFNHDTTISLEGSFSLDRMFLYNNHSFVSTNSSKPGAITLLGSGEICLGSDSHTANVTFNNIDITGGNIGGDRGLFIVNRTSKLILENNTKITSAGGNSICLVKENAQLELNDCGAISHLIYFGGGLSSTGHITVTEKAPRKIVKLVGPLVGTTVLTAESLKTQAVLDKFQIGENTNLVLNVDGQVVAK